MRFLPLLLLTTLVAAAEGERATPPLRVPPQPRYEVDVVWVPLTRGDPAYADALRRLAENAAIGFAVMSSSASGDRLCIVQQRVRYALPSETVDGFVGRLRLPAELPAETASALRRDVTTALAAEAKAHATAALGDGVPPAGTGSADARGSLQPKGE